MKGPVIHRMRSLIENSGGIRQLVGMKLTIIFPLFLVVALLAGCKKSETAATPPIDNSLPTQAQPKLPTMKIYLGAETLDAELALTEQQVQTGMMFRTNIQETDALLIRPHSQTQRTCHSHRFLWLWTL